MVKYNHSTNQRGQSVKLRAQPLKGPSSKVVDYAVANDEHILSYGNEDIAKKCTPQSSQILSTAELFSVVGQIWDSASQSLSRLQPGASFHSSNFRQKDNESYYSVAKNNLGILDFVRSRCLNINVKYSINVPCMVQRSLDCLRLIHEISYKPCDDHFIQIFFSKWHCTPVRHDVHLKEVSFTNLRFPYCLMESYRWMSQFSPLPELPVSASSGSKKNEDSSEVGAGACYPHSETEVGLSSNLGTGCFGLCFNKINSKNLLSGSSATVIMSGRASFSSLHSDNILQHIEDTLSSCAASTPIAASLEHCERNHASIADADSTCESDKLIIEDDDLLENKARQCEELDTQGELQCKSPSSATNQPHASIARQEHAVSGALAGAFVSLCLHPVDTVKTVIQSCRVGQTSIHYVGQSIISERGLTGLYRGITSNITTSAPISAIYTFTYESVKGSLLPTLSKEYHSVAHCSAGACASIATSFIFTPSERIKQQMQVSSQYKNCWDAVHRIIEKGGLRSLYAGWGAVLCRNIPHSIIKFYTYESLKKMLMSPENLNGKPSTLHTLLCGGLAGSAAALFSTPFDVVKTRLQTQVLGRFKCAWIFGNI